MPGFLIFRINIIYDFNNQRYKKTVHCDDTSKHIQQLRRTEVNHKIRILGPEFVKIVDIQ